MVTLTLSMHLHLPAPDPAHLTLTLSSLGGARDSPDLDDGALPQRGNGPVHQRLGLHLSPANLPGHPVRHLRQDPPALDIYISPVS